MSNILMNDSQDLRSVISENMKDDTHVTNPKAEVPKTSEASKAETQNEQPSKEQPTQEQETFAEKVDTTGMTPEQIQEVYSKYQKAYTQKRQKEKEEIRQYQEKIRAYEAMLQNISQNVAPNVPPQAQSQRQQEIQEQFDLGNLSFEEYTKAMRLASQEDARKIAEEVILQREDRANQEQMLQRFNTLDERFAKKYTDAESPEYNPVNAWLYKNVAMEVGNALDAYIQEHGSSIGFDSDTVAKEAIKHFDGLIDAIVASKVKQSTQQAQNKASEISRSNPKGKVAQSNTIGSRNLRDIISANMGD